MIPNRTLVRFLWIGVIFLAFLSLAVATIRPIMGTFFAAALMQGHVPEPKEFFGTAFWVGFTLQTIAAEIWINYAPRPVSPFLPVPRQVYLTPPGQNS